MQQVQRIAVAALAVLALVYLGSLASAQQEPVQQIKLSVSQVEGFIAAHKDVLQVLEKVATESSEAAAQAQLDAVAKGYGFKSHAEYETVATNIAMVMYGIDPQTKEFTDPPTLARNELDAALADKSVSKTDIDELTEQARTVQPIMHPGNIELVKRYYDKLEQLVQ